VAASTEGLCNAIFELAAGVEPGHISIPTDVWTVFDIIFTVVSVVAILSIIVSLLLKRRGVILFLGITLLVLLIAVCVVMPMVFGAGLGEIAFTWAPYSFAGGLILMGIGVVVAGVRFFLSEKKHAY
jgi:hypothetical protein